jgi:hypothetical protein
MFPTKLKFAAAIMLAAAFVCGTGVLIDQALAAEQPSAQAADAATRKLLVEKFEDVQKLIKPQPGESRWMEIPWQVSLWEARQKAAAEGKPMFVWSGSGGAPCAPT